MFDINLVCPSKSSDQVAA